MASWHPALWLLIMGPCCLVVRTRCPELGWWFSAAANGKKRRIGNSDYQRSWCLFFKISRCSDGNCRGLALKPCLSSSLCVPGHQVSADSGHLATLALSHLTYHLKSCLLPCHPQGHHEVSLVLGVMGLRWCCGFPAVLVPNLLYYAPIYLFIFLAVSLMNDLVRQAV